jgi:hypothetical protein
VFRAGLNLTVNNYDVTPDTKQSLTAVVSNVDVLVCQESSLFVCCQVVDLICCTPLDPAERVDGV